MFLAKRGAGHLQATGGQRILPEYAGSRRFRHVFIEEARLATQQTNIVQIYEFRSGRRRLASVDGVCGGADLGHIISGLRKQAGDAALDRGGGRRGSGQGLHYAHSVTKRTSLAIVHVTSRLKTCWCLERRGQDCRFWYRGANLFREEAGVLETSGLHVPEQALVRPSTDGATCTPRIVLTSV